MTAARPIWAVRAADRTAAKSQRHGHPEAALWSHQIISLDDDKIVTVLLVLLYCASIPCVFLALQCFFWLSFTCCLECGTWMDHKSIQVAHGLQYWEGNRPAFLNRPSHIPSRIQGAPCCSTMSFLLLRYSSTSSLLKKLPRDVWAICKCAVEWLFGKFSPEPFVTGYQFVLLLLIWAGKT